MEQKKINWKAFFKIDFLGCVAILVLLVGIYFLIQETQACSDPYAKLIEPYIKDKNISYDYSELAFYKNVGKESIFIDSIPLQGIKYERDNIFGVQFLNKTP